MSFTTSKTLRGWRSFVFCSLFRSSLHCPSLRTSGETFVVSEEAFLSLFELVLVVLGSPSCLMFVYFEEYLVLAWLARYRGRRP